MTINFQKLHFPNVDQFSENFIEMVLIGWDEATKLEWDAQVFRPCYTTDVYVSYVQRMCVHRLNGENGIPTKHIFRVDMRLIFNEFRML